jgi:hypothetical protein
MIILGTNSIKDTGYNVANSCRFNDGDNPSLKKTPSGAGSLTNWTFSCWVKRSTVSNAQQMIAMALASSGNDTQINFSSGDQIEFFNRSGGSVNGMLLTNRVFRDVSSWYHIVAVWNSDDGTAGNRMRLYINGTEETSFATDTNPSADTASKFNSACEHVIGQANSGSADFDGYLAEVVYIDGQALTPSSFGEFDEDSPTIWKPKDVSGLTFGTNGFYLDFEDSSNLGNDIAGNGDWTEANLDATDQSTDTCTNNFATLNPLDVVILSTIGTFSEGNLQIVSGQGSSSSNGYSFYLGSIGLSTGKWYWEVKCTNTGAASLIGIVDGLLTSKADSLDDATYGYSYRHSNGNLYNNNSNASYGNSYSTSDIIGVYLDLDNNKLYFGKNGVVQNSGTGKDITAAANTRTGFYFPTVGDTDYSTTSTWQFNFGAGSPISVSSGNADPNGYGNFEYDPSSGTFDSASKSFYAINTKNLAEFG